jgi:hypothetical protein
MVIGIGEISGIGFKGDFVHKSLYCKSRRPVSARGVLAGLKIWLPHPSYWT